MSGIRLHIVYNGERANGKALQKSKIQYQPRVLFDGEKGKLYTLLMTDPDAPAKSWLHWMITNIPGSHPDISQGDEIVSYAPPSPPSGIHRYFFTIYEQPASIIARAPGERGNFNVTAFERQHNLQKVIERIVKVPA